MKLIRLIIAGLVLISGSYLFCANRSSGWYNVRNEYVRLHPYCAVCGSVKKLQVHHIVPFSKNPALELDPNNLITLCESHHCHLIFGHLGSFKSYNVDVRKDAEYMYNKIKNRP